MLIITIIIIIITKFKDNVKFVAGFFTPQKNVDRCRREPNYAVHNLLD